MLWKVKKTLIGVNRLNYLQGVEENRREICSSPGWSENRRYRQPTQTKSYVCRLCSAYLIWDTYSGIFLVGLIQVRLTFFISTVCENILIRSFLCKSKFIYLLPKYKASDAGAWGPRLIARKSALKWHNYRMFWSPIIVLSKQIIGDQNIR